MPLWVSKPTLCARWWLEQLPLDRLWLFPHGRNGEFWGYKPELLVLLRTWFACLFFVLHCNESLIVPELVSNRSVVGMASVCLASWACHQAALFTLYSRDHIRSSCSNNRTIDISDQLRSSWTSWRQEQQRIALAYDRRYRDDHVDARCFRLPMHTIRV